MNRQTFDVVVRPRKRAGRVAPANGCPTQPRKGDDIDFHSRTSKEGAGQARQRAVQHAAAGHDGVLRHGVRRPGRHGVELREGRLRPVGYARQPVHHDGVLLVPDPVGAGRHADEPHRSPHDGAGQHRRDRRRLPAADHRLPDPVQGVPAGLHRDLVPRP